MKSILFDISLAASKSAHDRIFLGVNIQIGSRQRMLIKHSNKLAKLSEIKMTYSIAVFRLHATL